jgi:DinB superfamily
MTIAELLCDAFAGIGEVTHKAVAGMTPGQLAFRPDDQANSIAWLIWHLTRIQDDHIADAAGTSQVWTSAGWADRFGLPFEPSAH